MSPAQEYKKVRLNELKSHLKDFWDNSEEMIHEFMVHVLEEVRDHFRKSPDLDVAVMSFRHYKHTEIDTITVVIRREEAFCCDSDKKHRLCTAIDQ